MSTKRKKHRAQSTVQATTKKAAISTVCGQITDGITLQELFRLVGRDRLCELYADYWSKKIADYDGLDGKSTDDLYAEFDHEAEGLVDSILDADIVPPDIFLRIPSDIHLRVTRSASRTEPELWQLTFDRPTDAVQIAGVKTNLFAHNDVCANYHAADPTTRQNAAESAALIIMCWETRYITKTVHMLTALTDRLHDSRWERTYVPLDTPEMWSEESADALCTDFSEKTFTLVKMSGCVTLYRTDDTGITRPLATTQSKELRAPLSSLFDAALRSCEETADAAAKRAIRDGFGDFVRVRDLFRAVTYPDRLAWDVTDWEAASETVSDEEMLRERYRTYRKAKAAIRAILESTGESDEVIIVDDRDDVPLNWKALFGNDLPGSFTDLYSPDSAADDDIKDTAVTLAAGIILGSII